MGMIVALDQESILFNSGAGAMDDGPPLLPLAQVYMPGL